MQEWRGNRDTHWRCVNQGDAHLCPACTRLPSCPRYSPKHKTVLAAMGAALRVALLLAVALCAPLTAAHTLSGTQSPSSLFQRPPERPALDLLHPRLARPPSANAFTPEQVGQARAIGCTGGRRRRWGDPPPPAAAARQPHPLLC